MKKISLLLLFILTVAGVSSVSAQTMQEEVPPYKKDLHLPDFIILQTDSTWLTRDQLPKYEYTAIVYFSPDCGHCQVTVTDLLKKMDSLKNVLFVFVAYKPLSELKEFYAYYGLNKFQNIRMGRDPKYFIPAFFRVTATPFVAVYNSSGVLNRVFDPASNTTIEVPELLALVNNH